jgi:Phospholipase_D-nuclease N-terminal
MHFALIGEGGLFIIGVLFWLWMIYECMRREQGTERILWLLLVVLVPDLGSLIYFLVRVVGIRR